MGKLGPAVRVAITGTTVSPAIDHTVYLCGRSEALARLKTALAKLPG
jgi:glutamyl-tRNA synthetase